MMQRSAGALIGLALTLCGLLDASAAEPVKKIVLLTQGSDGHPAATHEYVGGAKVMTACLQQTPGVEVTTVRADDNWSEAAELLKTADGVVLGVAEGAKWTQADPRRYDALTKLAARGGGIVALHWAIGARDAKDIEGFQKLLGGCHGGPDRKYKVLETDVKPVEEKHPVTRGLKPIRLHDEFYYQLKFVKDEKLHPLLEAVVENKPQTVAWAWERPDGGRSFGFSALHFHENWKQETYRRLVTNGILWSLKVEIPENGAPVDVTDDVLKLN